VAIEPESYRRSVESHQACTARKLRREVSATVTITVAKDADGEEVLRIRADDPDVEEPLASRLVAVS